MTKIDLDSSRILHHVNKLKEWQSEKFVTPIMMDMSLTQLCNYSCVYCYSQLYQQGQKVKHKITWPIAKAFLDDASELGIKAISLISDGESTVNPVYKRFIKYGYKKGINQALGTNGSLLTKKALNEIMPCLTYLRFNISAFDKNRYCEIHGTTEKNYNRVIQNIKDAVKIKHKYKLPLDLGLQMVLKPEFSDQIIPLSQFAIDSGVDYLVIKHCSDNEDSGMKLDYKKYDDMNKILKQAEKMSTKKTRIVVKWNKINNKGKIPFKQCYAPPLQLQISGTGLVSPCGFKFDDKYKQYHIGNFCEQRFKDIVMSDRYQKVMSHLASKKFNAQVECKNSNCLQYYNNCVLDQIKKGKIDISKMKQKKIAFGNNFI